MLLCRFIHIASFPAAPGTTTQANTSHRVPPNLEVQLSVIVAAGYSRTVLVSLIGESSAVPSRTKRRQELTAVAKTGLHSPTLFSLLLHTASIGEFGFNLVAVFT